MVGNRYKKCLKDCHALVTNMSLAAVDAVLNKVPIVTHKNNVCYPLSGNIANIEENTVKKSREYVTIWLNTVCNNQFTLQEIEDGLAYETLKVQYA